MCAARSLDAHGEGAAAKSRSGRDPSRMVATERGRRAQNAGRRAALTMERKTTTSGFALVRAGLASGIRSLRAVSLPANVFGVRGLQRVRRGASFWPGAAVPTALVNLSRQRASPRGEHELLNRRANLLRSERNLPGFPRDPSALGVCSIAVGILPLAPVWS
jgi:hypothetical protein